MLSTLTEEIATPYVHVLGVRFHRLSSKQAVEKILHWIDEKSSRMVITAGPEFVMMAHHDETVSEIAHRADLVTPDGIGVVWAAKRQQLPVPERVTGVELVHHLFTTAADRKRKLKVYIFGASSESLAKCIEIFKDTFPNIEFRGRNGFFQKSELPSILSDIAAFKPDVWLVGIGQPRQERLIYQSLGQLPPCVAIGVGGSIDVWGGTVKRAPQMFRRMNIEWAYRLVSQPKRWRRQLALPRFMWHVLKSADRKH